MTQLPAAGQLSGEARTQVAQLITNFNELIGNPADWHVSYQKVAANLSTLLGPDNSDAEATAGAPTTATVPRLLLVRRRRVPRQLPVRRLQAR